MTEFVLIRPDDLLDMIRRAVREELAASQPKPAPEPAGPDFRTVGLLELGPLIGRQWCYCTARTVTLRPGFPRTVAKASGSQPLRWRRIDALLWLRQHEGVLPLARVGKLRHAGKHAGDTPNVSDTNSTSTDSG